MDFETYANTLNARLARNDFRAAGPSMQKIYGNALCVLRVLDGSAAAQPVEPGTNGLPGLAVFVVHLYVFAGDANEIPEWFHNGEEYRDQAVYHIRWGVRLEESAAPFFCAEGQPDQCQDLRRIISEAEAEAYGRADVGDEPVAPARAVPFCAYALIALNGLILLLTYAAGGPDDIATLIRFGALDPRRVFGHGEYYRLLTAMFLHAGAAHFLSNALGLHIFGARMERFLGHGWFLALYFVSGISGSVLSLFLSRGVGVGASGGILGLVGAALSVTLLSRRALEEFSLYTLVIYSIVALGFGFLYENIGHWAHFGGYVAGFATGFGIYRLKKR